MSTVTLSLPPISDLRLRSRPFITARASSKTASLSPPTVIASVIFLVIVRRWPMALTEWPVRIVSTDL